MRQDFLTIHGEPNASVTKFVAPNGTDPTAEEDVESVLDVDLMLGYGRAGVNWYWMSNGWMPASRLDRNSSMGPFMRRCPELHGHSPQQFVLELGSCFW